MTPTARIAGTGHGRAARILAAIAISLVAAYALYLAGANVIIRTHLLRSWINKGPDKTTVEYASAYTLWPGRIHVTGFVVRDTDKHADWRISLDEGGARIGLLDLLRRRFHTSWIRGRGVVIRVRTRLPAAEATPRWLSYLPPMPEYPDPPIENPDQREEPLPPSSEIWNVRLDGIAVEDVREIWVDAYRFNGTARLTGGLHLVPRQTLEIPKNVLDVQDGAMHYKNLLAAEGLKAHIETAVDECDLKPMRGADILRFMSGLGRVEGRMDGAEVLDEIVGIAPHVRFQKGNGPLLAEMSLDRGRGTGHLELSLDGVRAVTEGITLDGRMDGTMRLASLDLDRGIADFTGSRLRLRDIVVTKTGSGKTRPWWMALDVGKGRLATDPPRVFRASITATARDARPLYRLLNTGLPHWAEGLLELDSMSAHANVAIGPSLLEVDSLRAEGDEYRIEGRYRKRGSTGHGLFLVSRGHADLAAAVGGDKTELKLFGSEKWYRERAASF